MGHSEVSGQRLFHDDVLPGIGRTNRKFMVQRRRHANVHHVNIIPGQQRVVVFGDKRDPGFPRQRLAAFLCPGANSPDCHKVLGHPGVICQMHPRPVARARHANAQRLHTRVPVKPACGERDIIFQSDQYIHSASHNWFLAAGRKPAQRRPSQ